MPFQTACPFCPTKLNRVPDRVLGASVRCPQCGNFFTAAPVDDLPVSASYRRPAAMRPAVNAVAEPPPAQPAATAIKIIEVVSAVPVATETPVAPAGSSAGELGSRFRGLFWCGGGTCLVVVIAALFWPRAPSRHGRHELLLGDPDPYQFLVATLDNRQVIKDLGRSEWASAEKESLRQGELHFRIAWVKVDVPPSKKTGKPKSLQKSLLIQVQVAHVNPGKLGQFKGVVRDTKPPVLGNDTGAKYAFRTFPPEAGVNDQIERLRSSSGERVQQLLVFEPPDADTQSLKLEFPAAAWGGAGAVRFRIPRSMIDFAD